MKKLLYSVLIVLALAIIVTFGASFYMLHYSLHNDSPEYDEAREIARIDSIYPYVKPWMDSITANHLLRDTFIIGQEGERLHAYYLKANSTRKTALLVHGYKDCAMRMMMIGYMYNHDFGCNILLPDLHSHGLSEGEDIRMGWKDRLDVIRWAGIADTLFGGNTRMVIHGISMGAATTMMASGEKSVPRCVEAFVEDCGYTSAWDEFKGELKKQFSLPAFPLMYTTSLLCKIRYGWSFQEASALKQIPKCNRPMLFIHGDADDFVPTEMVYPLIKAHTSKRIYWLAPGTDHAHAYRDYPVEYAKRVQWFVPFLHN